MAISDAEINKKLDKYFSMTEKALSLITEKNNERAKDFISMAGGRNNVVSEAIKRNIIILGIEEYYRLMQHAR